MNLSYRKGVGIFLLNKKKDVWVGKRIDNKNNFWQLPQGGVEENESYEVAMLRELKEEIGTNNVKILGSNKGFLRYTIPDSLIAKIWDGKFKGQSQKWFVCEFLDEDSKINLNFHKPEFCEWRWIKPELLTKVVIPFKKKLYEEILKAFKDYY